jgi:diguanylate cyclase (GGDEF)-like protein
MTIHPAFLRLSAILPIGIALLAMILFAFEFDILANGGPARGGRQKLELEEMSLLGALLSAALGIMALFNRSWMMRERGLRQSVEREAFTDALTGLANRRQFLRVANERLAAAARSSQLCAILLIDLDRFKPVNDRFGHAAGDAVLVAIAQRLGLALPVEHVAGRLGGDEFAVLLGPASNLKIEYCAEHLSRRIARPIIHGADELRVGASIGVALAPDDGHGAAALLAAADERMYDRKRGRRRANVEIAA